jgi:hypothetical protein
MRRMLSGVAVLMVGAAIGSTLEAQTCQGLNPPTNIQVSAFVPDGAKEFGAKAHFGKATGVFFGIGGHYTSFDDVGTVDGGSFKGVTGTIGAQMGGGDKKPSFCPIATVGYGTGDGDTSEIVGTAGLSVGIPVAAGGDFTLIPTAALTAVYSRFKVGGTGPGTGTFKDGTGVISAGVGFMISPRFVLKPEVSRAIIGLPDGFDADFVFGITASLGIGKGGN